MMLQHLRQEDHTKRLHFCVSFQDLCSDDDFLKGLQVSDKAKFHISGKVNKQNVHIWGTEKPHRIVEDERDSPKTNVFCAISTSKVYGPYFFPDRTMNGETFLNILTTWLMPQLEHDSTDFAYQLDGAPCHITVMFGTSLTKHCRIDGLEEQTTMIIIFYSGHRGHRT